MGDGRRGMSDQAVADGVGAAARLYDAVAGVDHRAEPRRGDGDRHAWFGPAQSVALRRRDPHRRLRCRDGPAGDPRSARGRRAASRAVFAGSVGRHRLPRVLGEAGVSNRRTLRAVRFARRRPRAGRGISAAAVLSHSVAMEVFRPAPSGKRPAAQPARRGVSLVFSPGDRLGTAPRVVGARARLAQRRGRAVLLTADRPADRHPPLESGRPLAGHARHGARVVPPYRDRIVRDALEAGRRDDVRRGTDSPFRRRPLGFES